MQPSSSSRPGVAAALLLLAAVILTGCAPANTQGGRDRSVLTYEEINSVGAANLYEVVERTRPRWLEGRATASLAALDQSLGDRTGGLPPVLVYHDQSRLGDVNILRQLPVSGTRTMRFLNAAQASATLPGISHGQVAGAIVISTQ